MASRTDAVVRKVISEVGPTLKEAGFRRHDRRFNRTTEPGLVQVLEFKTARYPLPGNGWGDYGRFSVNFGIWIHDLRDLHWQPRPDGAIREIDCHVRASMEDLVPGSGDGWWELFESASAGAEALKAINQVGLPWLGGLTTRRAILDAIPADEPTFVFVTPRWPLEVAVLRFGNGEEAVAAGLIADHLGKELDSDRRRYLVDELLPAWGLGHLVPRPSAPSGWPRRALVEFRTDALAYEGAPAGTTGVIVEVVAEGYLVQIIEPDGWGNLVGPVVDEDLALLATRGE